MKASEAVRRIIEEERKVPGRPALALPLDKVLTVRDHSLAFVAFEDLEKALIDCGE